MDVNIASTPSSTPTPAQNSSTGNTSVPQGTDGAGSLPTVASITKEFEAQSKPNQNRSPDSYEVKINGKVQKMSLQDLINHASMGGAANQRFQEAKQLREEAEKLKNGLSEKKIEAFKDMGMSDEQIQAMVEDYYYNKYIAPTELTEEQREFQETKKRLEAYEAKEKKAKEDQEKAEMEKLTNVQREFVQKQIIEAMEKSGLTKTKFFASRMAFYMRQNMLNGWEAPIEMIVSQVRNERQQLISDIVSNSDAKQLLELLGEDVANKIRKYDLEQLRAKRGQSANFSKNEAAPPKKEEKIDYRTVNERLREARLKGF